MIEVVVITCEPGVIGTDWINTPNLLQMSAAAAAYHIMVAKVT
jgi:hypothetical protein